MEKPYYGMTTWSPLYVHLNDASVCALIIDHNFGSFPFSGPSLLLLVSMATGDKLDPTQPERGAPSTASPPPHGTALGPSAVPFRWPRPARGGGRRGARHEQRGSPLVARANPWRTRRASAGHRDLSSRPWSGGRGCCSEVNNFPFLFSLCVPGIDFWFSFFVQLYSLQQEHVGSCSSNEKMIEILVRKK